MTFHHYPGGSAGAIGAAIRHARRHLCARLADTADSTCTPDDRFVHAFPAVVTAVEVGFRHEELVMESLDYERLHEHRANPDALRRNSDPPQGVAEQVSA